MPNFAIDRSQKIERHGNLDHIGVDHDEIAHGHGPVLNADSRHHHDRDKAAGDQEGLTEIQEGQRIGGLQRGALIARHCRVIAHRLAALGPEILDRLKIQKTIDCLLIGVGVLIVHLFA